MRVAIIPAKGKSVGIPNKNLKLLGGIPLLQWTLEECHVAWQRDALDEVIVSTDSDDVKALCKSLHFPALVVQHRPEKLCANDVHAYDVVEYALKESRITPDVFPHSVVHMLLPTSPFRTHEHIDTANNYMACTGLVRFVHGVIGVKAGERASGRRSVATNGYLAGYIGHNIQRQAEGSGIGLQVNGAIFAAKIEDLLQHKTFHVPLSIGLYMDKISSIELDTMEDWALAERML